MPYGRGNRITFNGMSYGRYTKLATVRPKMLELRSLLQRSYDIHFQRPYDPTPELDDLIQQSSDIADRINHNPKIDKVSYDSTFWTTTTVSVTAIGSIVRFIGANIWLKFKFGAISAIAQSAGAFTNIRSIPKIFGMLPGSATLSITTPRGIIDELSEIEKNTSGCFGNNTNLYSI